MKAGLSCCTLRCWGSKVSTGRQRSLLWFSEFARPHSREHGDEPRRAPVGKGRDRALDEPQSVPGRPRQEGHHHRGDGRIGQPHIGGQGSA